MNTTFIPRELIDHKINELNERLRIRVMDEPGAGGACHNYLIDLVTSVPGQEAGGLKSWHLEFQNGPVKEAGFNGLTQEALLAVVIDRLRSFQAGPYACRENAIALTHIETGLMWLHRRTMKREARGVEGTHAQ